ncbi:MAG: hypothetical protein LBT36_05800 [Oscillospiraceae bacterium]|jgi:X-X-X-Leu-X-X-Gly heptad repeat protein|nr:hypothetical protein [Oscillospiraceae bacterium]
MTKMKIRAALLSLTLLGALIAVPFARAETSAADAAPSAGKIASREEAVYAKLAPDGTVLEVYAVNQLHIAAPGSVSDFGAYSSVKNLTSLAEITRTDGGITVAVPDDADFYYQGTLAETALPWDVSITYTLDGRAAAPADLPGASGKLAITVATRANGENVFAESYMLQITLTLDSTRCRDIDAPGATAATVGTNKQLTLTVLPGETSENTVTADVTDFEMDGIQIAAVPFAMAITLPDLENVADFTPLTDAVSQLNRGASQLSSGAQTLASGAARLLPGSQSFKAGLNTLAAQGAPLTEGAAQMKAALDQLASALPAAEIQRLAAAFAEFQTGLNAYTAGVSQLATGYAEVDAGIAGLNTGASGVATGASQLAAGLGALDEQTSALPELMRETIAEITARYDVPEFAPVSFVSARNGETTAVQFVLQTEKIAKPAPPPAPVEAAPSRTFLEKLLDLFR